jgi:hypothetical protein
MNPYIGINVACGRTVIEDCKIGSYLSAITIDQCLDTVRILNCSIGQYFETCLGISPYSNIDLWNMANGNCISVGRCDGLYVDNLACGGRNIALLFHDGAGSGLTCGYGKLSNIDIDTVNYGVSCFAANNSAGGYKFSNMDIGLYNTPASPSGVSFISLGTGGSQAPLITWMGGSVRGASTTGYKGMQIGAGVADISHVFNYNPVGVFGTPALPATGGGINNPFPVRCRVFMNGIGGIGLTGNVGIANPQFVTLGPGERIIVTYAGSPTWTWFGE